MTTKLDAPSCGRTRDYPPETITVLFCAPRYSATKTFVMTGTRIEKHDFNAGMWFTSKVYPVTGIQELSAVLTMVEPIQSALLIRGDPQHGLDTSRPHQRTKKGPINYLTPVHGHRYAMIDIDKLALQAGLTLTKQTLPHVIDYVIGQLPAEFRNASFHWQLSSSAGVGDPTMISMHLWFWFDRPIADLDLKRWGKAVNLASGFNLIDTSLFNDVQAHYTAAPIFRNMDAPFPVRSGLIEKELHEVSLVLPVPCPSHHKASKRNSTSLYTASAGQGFEYHLSTIGDHPGGEGFHGPILSATASFVSINGAENVDKEWLCETVRDRVVAADCSRHTPAEVESRASREHIMAAIDGAIEKFGDRPERQPRLYDQIEPHYQSTPLTKVQADVKLGHAIRKYF